MSNTENLQCRDTWIGPGQHCGRRVWNPWVFVFRRLGLRVNGRILGFFSPPREYNKNTPYYIFIIVLYCRNAIEFRKRILTQILQEIDIVVNMPILRWMEIKFIKRWYFRRYNYTWNSTLATRVCTSKHGIVILTL